VWGYNVEALPGRRSVSVLNKAIVHTNHCVDPALVDHERSRSTLAMESTVMRLDQARGFLARHSGEIDKDVLMGLTRLREGDGFSVCQTAVKGYEVETSGACVMSPGTGEMWAVWGLPSENEYERFAPGEASGTG
jgi:isopenicillin-N N-acyltransferase like protein